MRLIAAFLGLLLAHFANADPPSREALQALDAVVKGYVDRGETVSAELMVIVGDDVVLHSVHGYADREAKRALAPDSIHCIRSMTKSVVGTAAQMLIDDGKLGLDDPVAKWIPAFNHDKHASITVRHLLEHTSGLPLSSLLTRETAALHSTDDVAGFAAEATLAFDPGAGFNYSDDGADALAVIVGKASGMSPEAFIKARILDPLGMRDTHCLVPEGRERFVTIYLGDTGHWTKLWAREDKPVFPVFLGSQGMFSTCGDYAKLIALWANDGKVGERRLLSQAAIERGLAPAHEMGYPTGFTGAKVNYGELWMMWIAEPSDGAAKSVLAFGHGGSDGTMAWHWPERDLTILYFTQSRGGTTPISIEREIDHLLLGGQRAAPADVTQLTGIFWDAERQRYVAVSCGDGKLMIEIPGRFAGTLVPTTDADRWTFEVDQTSAIRFQRDDAKSLSAIELESPNAKRHWPRLTADASLPSVESVVALVVKAHGFADAGAPFPLVRTGTVDVPNLKRHVRIRQEYDGLRARVETTPAQGPGQITVSDGVSTTTKAGDAAPQAESDLISEQSRLEHPGCAFGDWRRFYREVQVVARIDEEGQKRLVVRCAASFVPPTCFVIDEATGRVIGLERSVTIPGLGVVGAVTRLDDFRAIAGNGRSVTMPFHATTRFASPLLGVADTKIESVETPAAIDESRFTLK